MATSYNTTVKLYKSVPLIKGGTEVLYKSGSAAESELSQFQVGTYSAYYFERENRRYIQIDDVFGSLDDVNYISFANMSHGGKIYFAFVDQVVYINDHNTQIEFTLDPFPTFIGDTTLFTNSYIIRNTLLTDVRGANLQPDYLPRSCKTRFVVLDSLAVSCKNRARVVFAGKNGTGWPITSPAGYPSGIQYAVLSDTILQDIVDHGGSIIGAYMYPDAFQDGAQKIAEAGTPLTGNPLAHMATYTHEKLRTGIYTQVAIATSNTFKTYELEEFANVNSVSFGVVYFFAPAFSIFIYPKNYKGIPENTAEGVYLQGPSLSISAQQGYTAAQMSSDIFAGLMAGGSGAISGAAAGGWVGAIAGGVAGLAGGALNMAKNAYMSQFKTPQVFGGALPITDDDYTLRAYLVAVSPSLSDCIRIDDYFDYFGYNLEEMRLSAGVNLTDKAYLQTGCEFVHGSEADAALNARIMSGIKIRKTLS